MSVPTIITSTMELYSSSINLIRRLIVLFVLVSRISFGFIKIGGHFAQAEYNTSNNISNRIINACDSHLLNIGNGSSGIITLQSAHNPCSIFLTGPRGKSILLEFDEVDDNTFQYLFVERQDILSRRCNGRLVVFTSPPVRCNAIFNYSRLLLHLKGRVSLQLQPITNNDSTSHQCLSSYRCNSTCLQVPGTCNNIKIYHRISHCPVVSNPQLSLNQVQNVTTCLFTCPPGCTCTLHKHEVTAKCGDRQETKTFIVYPDDLKGLHLGSKRIHSLSSDAFEGLNNLKELSLFNNSLALLPSDVFNHNINMKWLDLSHNQIEKLQPFLFQKLTSLDSINLGHNTLSQLEPGTFGGMYSLNGLFLNNNQLKKLNPGIFRGTPNLKWLNLASNGLTDLQSGLFDGLTFLQNLDLQDNNLTLLEPADFRGLDRLTVLQLQKNEIKQLKADTFGSLQGLAFLNLEDNHLKKIHKKAFKKLRNLVSLALTNNRLSQFEPGLFAPLNNLRWLNLDENYITDLKPGMFWGLSFVEILLLQSNNITLLEPGIFEGIYNLQQLNMSHNKLNDIQRGTFKDLTNLRKLYLNGNNLTILEQGMFEGLVSLERLYLVRNQISEIHPGVFDGLHGLGILYLEGNNIKDIRTGVFKDLPNLNIIQLTNNQLSSLSRNTFHDLHTLHYLNLENNTLQKLEDDFCKNCDSLETLNIIGNPLQWVKIASFSGLTNSTQVLVDDHASCCFVEIANCTAQNQRPVFLTCERLLPKPILRICMWILGMCALCGNTFVLYTRLRQRRDREKVQSLLIIHLSCSDLLMGVYMLILTSADVHFGVYFPSHASAWRGGQTCQLASVLSVLSSEASVFFLTLISIDRLLGVKFPFSRFRLDLQSTKIVTSALWMFALTISTMPLLLSRINTDIYDVSEVCIGLPMARKSVTESKNRSVLLSRFYTKRIQVEVTENLDTEPGMYYSIAIFIGLNLLCFVIIVICYVLIFLTVKRSSRRAGRQRERDEEMRMAVKMAIIVMTDFLCWMPVIITGILVQSGAIEISPVLYAWMVTFVLPINSSVNPFMYTIATATSDRFQKQRPLHRINSVINYSHDQKTINKSSSDSNSIRVKYKDISSSQSRTDDTNKTSISQTVEMS